MCTAGGPVAQLGERHTGSVEVDGSIPFGSTTVSPYVVRDSLIAIIYSFVELVVLSAIL